MKKDHTAISITIPDTGNQSVEDSIDDALELCTDSENIDGVEVNIQRISGENTLELLDQLITGGYDITMNRMTIEVDH